MKHYRARHHKALGCLNPRTTARNCDTVGVIHARAKIGNLKRRWKKLTPNERAAIATAIHKSALKKKPKPTTRDALWLAGVWDASTQAIYFSKKDGSVSLSLGVGDEQSAARILSILGSGSIVNPYGGRFRVRLKGFAAVTHFIDTVAKHVTDRGRLLVALKGGA